jgi:ubiquinone/menaquinone biosynthesis C-methylase UbiE
MPSYRDPNRFVQCAAVAIIAILILGFAYSPVGMWTGAILGAWFISRLNPWRGFLWLAGISFVLRVLSHGRSLWQGGAAYAGWMVLAVLVDALPFLLYRLTNRRGQRFSGTLSLPLWGVACGVLAEWILPAGFSSQGSPNCGMVFATYWFAAVLCWMWDNEFQGRKAAAGIAALGAAVLLARLSLSHAMMHYFALCCVPAGLILLVWSQVRRGRREEPWAKKPETVALLRSPNTAEALRAVSEDGWEFLVSQSGERFPVRHGIPAFVNLEKITGSNRKYNELYATIGSFYDDIQRVACALRGISVAQYLWDYLRFVEVHPGDAVLETSVGTGLNFKYLPRGARLFGLDLSPEMLASCQANLRRWEMGAELFLGNAEELPFADESFDVVFHVGGINFFNDRAKAIREMIRVAKPGTRILIADETEEHVKGMYEQLPGSGYFKGREEAVVAPVDLVPAEMQEVELEILRKGRFYAITFRKPSLVQAIASR